MLVINDIRKSFGDLKVLDGIDLKVEDGEIVSVIGPSGCGKSTLLNIVSGIEHADSGTITGNEQPAAYVFQDDRLLPWSTVYENIALVKDVEDHGEIMDLIAEVGLKGFENYKPGKLSGGMKKRAGIARAFYYDSKLLLMDEPFTGLDYYLREEIMEMLLRIWKEKKPSVLLVTHDIDEALTLASKVAVMTGTGKIDQLFELPAYENRDLMSDEMISIRKEIMKLIRNRKKEKENESGKIS